MLADRLKGITDSNWNEICNEFGISKTLSKSMKIEEIMRRYKFYKEENSILGMNLLDTIIKTFAPMPLDEINCIQITLAIRFKMKLENFILLYGEQFRQVVNSGLTNIDLIEEKLRELVI